MGEIMFEGFYKGKTVLVTGHTGFKGSWLCSWLLYMGANVVGYSKNIPTNPSLFELNHLENKISHIQNDVRDLDKLKECVNHFSPDIVFHLAAQPIVSKSFEEPGETFSTNVMGTFNVLESLKSYKKNCVVILITSDKCYDNLEWCWGYRETDKLGGKDIYSGSKGAAELVIKSMFETFFKSSNENIKIGIGRAGNVIGGGDWALDRIVPDVFKSWNDKKLVNIRSPYATRPWQHVLEPLSGYLSLCHSLSLELTQSGEAYNFGPNEVKDRSVIDLIDGLSDIWGNNIKEKSFSYDKSSLLESSLLKLNCDKASKFLFWNSVLTFEETVKFTGLWYKNFYKNKLDSLLMVNKDIELYHKLAKNRCLNWAQ